MPVSVGIVEDNRELREGLAQLLRATPGFRCAGAYGNCEEMLRALERTHPDVILMDIGLPGMSGVEGVRCLKNQLPSTDVLMLTIYSDDRRIFESICAGASGYLLKRTSPAKILEAIRDIRTGGSPMSGRIARRVLERLRSDTAGSGAAPGFSDREQEILSSLVDGLSYKMIAGQWNISVDTVRSHIKNIYAKLHVHSKSEAVAKTLRGRLL